MNKLLDVIKGIAFDMIFKDKDKLAKDIAKAIDIPLIGEEREKELALAIIEVVEKAIKK